MKTFTLTKTKQVGNFRQVCDYILSIETDCRTSPRGNTHCAMGGQHVFLNKEDLDNLLNTLKEGKDESLEKEGSTLPEV
jgi:hypothetical protein